MTCCSISFQVITAPCTIWALISIHSSRDLLACARLLTYRLHTCTDTHAMHSDLLDYLGSLVKLICQSGMHITGLPWYAASYTLLLPACVTASLTAGSPSTSFWGAQLMILMFVAASESWLMLPALAREQLCHMQLVGIAYKSGGPLKCSRHCTTAVSI